MALKRVCHDEVLRALFGPLTSSSPLSDVRVFEAWFGFFINEPLRKIVGGLVGRSIQRLGDKGAHFDCNKDKRSWWHGH